ncbi:ATP-binding protein [Desulfurivibrio dismutans]|uniref:ATP-binding protein n=1 Tax=Desulfurivibrio dismutans TaxID=1398908 RepID=UPI0023D9C0D8|nr:ATP-binding protein [Desulfurivibrio alkaliphilus]MDF1613534.1 ATP-binding protein [Desulfurivibrio alkaliphilus]
MSDQHHRRAITVLVWTLVAIGLLAGVFTNGLMVWTLLDLNRERIQLLEEDRQLSQLAARLQRLGQGARSDLALLLQGLETDDSAASVAAFTTAVSDLRHELGDYPGMTALADLSAAAAELTVLHSRAVDWRRRYRPVADDQQEKRTLGRVRVVLEEMRAAAETLEGRQRLAEALALRRWRTAEAEQAPALAQEFLEQHAGGGPQNNPLMIKEIRSELAELSRLVETLAGEDQLDHLADLRDNQLKQVLERLERQLFLLAEENGPAAGLEGERVAALRELIFGRGYVLLPEYQTIRPGEGGLFRLSGDVLQLRRERETLQVRTQELFARTERIYPVLADLARERSAAMTDHAEAMLARVMLNLLLLSILVLCGFLGLGWLIGRRVNHQVRTMTRLRRDNELILQSAGEGIMGLDAAGRVSFVNPAGSRLLGGSAVEINGRCFDRIVSRRGEESGCGPHSALLEQVLGRGQSVHEDDYHIQRLDGSRFSGEFTANPIYNEQGEIEGAVVTFLDITERKQAAEVLEHTCLELDELNRSLEAKVAARTRDLEEKNRELIQAQEELVRKEKLAAIGLLGAGVAHEINNPAAIIRGNVEIIRRRLAGGEGEEEVAEILKNTERISRITRSLLLFAREHEQPTAPAEEVQVNELLNEIVAQAAHQVDCTGLEVKRDYDRQLPRFLGDQEKLRQLFTNLVINAVQAMEGQGRLELITRLAADELEADGSRGDWLEVVVRDTGPGIVAAAQGEIFNPFYTTKKSGSGLGLAVSYGIVQALGGEITVDSQPGRGAAIKVRLPV